MFIAACFISSLLIISSLAPGFYKKSNCFGRNLPVPELYLHPLHGQLVALVTVSVTISSPAPLELEELAGSIQDH